MDRRSFFKLLSISPAALMFKPKKKSAVNIGEQYIKRTQILDCIDPEIMSKIILSRYDIQHPPLHPMCKCKMIAITAYEVNSKWVV